MKGSSIKNNDSFLLISLSYNNEKKNKIRNNIKALEKSEYSCQFLMINKDHYFELSKDNLS